MIIKHMPITKASPDDGGQYWIGYYDKQPWSADGSRMLSHRAEFLDHYPTASETCEIGTIKDGTFHAAATTRAWNWQQGAHLRWAMYEGQECLMYNDLDDDNKPVCRWVTVDGKQLNQLNTPIYSVTPDGTTGLTLEFGRLTRLREEYGYPALQDLHPDHPAPPTEGIWSVDLQTGERSLLASFEQLAAIDDTNAGLANLDGPHQHVNHIMVNPSGTRCCFLHRYERDDAILQSRLFSVAIDGSDSPRLLIEGMVSHYDWMNNDAILAWGGKRKLLGSSSAKRTPKARLMSLARRTLKPIYYAMGKPRFLMNKVMGDSYIIIPDQPNSQTTTFAKGELICDGHNTFYRGSKGPNAAAGDQWMVTDGYPDMKFKQPLYLWDLKADQGYEIGRYHTPKELDGPVRIDLHPRFSRDGHTICIDSALDNTRAIYSIDVSGLTTPNTSERSL